MHLTIELTELSFIRGSWTANHMLNHFVSVSQASCRLFSNYMLWIQQLAQRHKILQPGKKPIVQPIPAFVRWKSCIIPPQTFCLFVVLQASWRRVTFQCADASFSTTCARWQDEEEIEIFQHNSVKIHNEKQEIRPGDSCPQPDWTINQLQWGYALWINSIESRDWGTRHPVNSLNYKEAWTRNGVPPSFLGLHMCTCRGLFALAIYISFFIVQCPVPPSGGCIIKLNFYKGGQVKTRLYG